MDIDWMNRSLDLKPHIRNLIDGQSRSPGGSETLQKYSPRDGRLLYQFGGGDERDVESAVFSAKRAFEDGRWCRVSPQRRKETLQRLAALIDRHCEELALLECLDVGKPISGVLSFDIPRAASLVRFNAEAIDKLYGNVYSFDRSSLAYQLCRPIGVVAGIIGWNFPLYLAVMKIAPVLATGNCLVLKPSELTSFSAVRLAELALEAGVPEGVLNVVHGGPSIGAALAHHPMVDVLTFTGSTRTGKQLLIASGQSNMKRLILECGGKAPNIVFDDFDDLDAVADGVTARAFWNQGQVCSASSRVLVQEDIKDRLLALVIEKACALNPGDPLKPETKFGALVSAAHKSKVLGYIDAGKGGGATMAHQSKFTAPFSDGFYVAPTIFDGVLPEQTIAQEEIFGPVLSVMSFRDEDEAIRIANSTIYGLTAVLWTKDLGRAHRVTQQINSGSTVVNATGRPTGGVGVGVLSVGGHKESGFGSEGGLESLNHYLHKTAVQVFV
jgi:acyl-CoA reductase-like NAD-dependent aldehyde dehydrogenase